jgi:hypothetical protein
VFDSVHWDAAFGLLELFLTGLAEFAAALLSHFSPATVFVYRTANYFAGIDTHNYRFFTTQRVELFNAEALRIFRSVLGDRLRVWDTYVIGRGRPLSTTEAMVTRCGSGHEPSHVVAVEVQVLLHMLCE